MQLIIYIMEAENQESSWIYIGHMFLITNANSVQLNQLKQLDPVTPFSSQVRVKKDPLLQWDRRQIFLSIEMGKISLTLQIQPQQNKELQQRRIARQGQEESNICLIRRDMVQNLISKGNQDLYKLDCATLLRFDRIPEKQQQKQLGEAQIKEQVKQNRDKIQQQQKIIYECLLSVNLYLSKRRIQEWDDNFDFDPQFGRSRFNRRMDLLFDNIKQNRSNWNQNYMDEQVRKRYGLKTVNNQQQQDMEDQGLQLQQVQTGKKKLKVFDLSSYHIPQTSQPKGFAGKLIPYQKQALTWMLYRENAIKDISMDMMHSNWENLKQVLNVDEDLYFNPEYSVLLRRKPIKQCKGGIIADQMGLGKTIMMISLILANDPVGDSREKITLVISPLSVLHQWEKQIQKFAPSLKICKYYEKGRKLEAIRNKDIVLISQGVVRSEYVKSKDSSRQGLTIFDIQWFRVIIDQAHNFKNSRSKGSNAVWELSTEYRWCLTGTPAQNCYGDLYSLMKFLHYKPWDNLNYWNNQIPKSVDRKMEKNIFLVKRIQQILKGIMIRRTKSTKNQQGNNILQLPKLSNLQLDVQLQQAIKKDYAFLVDLSLKKLGQLERAQKIYETQDTGDRLKKFKQRKQIEKMVNFIMAKLMILRQLCCHSFMFNYSNQLVRYDQFVEKYDKFLSKKNIRSFKRSYESYEKVKDIANKTKFKCQMCKQIPLQGVISPCLHVYCKQCATAYAKQQLLREEENNKTGPYAFSFEQSVMKTAKKKLKKRLVQVQVECFACKNKIQYQNFFPMPRLNHFDRNIQQFAYNQKFSMLVHGLRSLKQNEKAIIYTNFLGVVMLLQETMRRQRIIHEVIKGQDRQKSRENKIRDFQRVPQLKVLIITLKSGCVGLNLQIANKVFIMDPWWNPFIEDQAIARSHRIGQNKDVQVVTFVTRNTIEERVKELKDIKREIVADLMMDQLQLQVEEDEDQYQQQKQKINKKGPKSKLKKTEQFRILLEANEKYNKTISQIKKKSQNQDQDQNMRQE